jgi:replicative DNA helicase
MAAPPDHQDGYESTIHFPGNTSPPVSLRESNDRIDRTLPTINPAVLKPIPTGFPLLDACMGGGLHAEDLIMVVGKQNVGKTVFVNQIARNIARWSARERNHVAALVVCYEHSVMLLRHRILCMESWLASGKEDAISLAAIRQAMADLSEENQLRDFSNALVHLPDAAMRGWQAMEEYFDTLFLYQGNPLFTTTDALERMVVFLMRKGFHPVLFVDYMQRVPSPAVMTLAREVQLDSVIRALKTIAMMRKIPVIAVGAVDERALRRPGPVHLEDLWGPATMTYEPDGAWVLNPDSLQPTGEADRARTIRLAVEKNRHGASEVEWRHHLYGACFTIEAHGEVVRLEESFQSDRLR